MSKKIPLAALASILVLTAILAQSAIAQESRVGNQKNHIRQVLLVSIDGMHGVDYLNCSEGVPGVNGGRPGHDFAEHANRQLPATLGIKCRRSDRSHRR